MPSLTHRGWCSPACQSPQVAALYCQEYPVHSPQPTGSHGPDPSHDLCPHRCWWRVVLGPEADPVVESRHCPVRSVPPGHHRPLQACSLAGVPLLPSLSFQGLPGLRGHFFGVHLVPGVRKGHLPQEVGESQEAQPQHGQHAQHLQETQPCRVLVGRDSPSSTGTRGQAPQRTSCSWGRSQWGRGARREARPL